MFHIFGIEKHKYLSASGQATMQFLNEHNMLHSYLKQYKINVEYEPNTIINNNCGSRTVRKQIL